MISAELMTSRQSTNQIFAWIGLEVGIPWVCTLDFSMELLSWTHRIYTFFSQMLLADYLSYMIFHDSDLYTDSIHELISTLEYDGRIVGQIRGLSSPFL